MRNAEKVISRLFRCFGIRHWAFSIDASGFFISLLAGPRHTRDEVAKIPDRPELVPHLAKDLSMLLELPSVSGLRF